MNIFESLYEYIGNKFVWGTWLWTCKFLFTIRRLCERVSAKPSMVATCQSIGRIHSISRISIIHHCAKRVHNRLMYANRRIKPFIRNMYVRVCVCMCECVSTAWSRNSSRGRSKAHGENKSFKLYTRNEQSASRFRVTWRLSTSRFKTTTTSRTVKKSGFQLLAGGELENAVHLERPVGKWSKSDTTYFMYTYFCKSQL